MTRYLVTAQKDGRTVRECWSEAKTSMTEAALYAEQLQRLFPDFEYTVRPVSNA